MDPKINSKTITKISLFIVLLLLTIPNIQAGNEFKHVLYVPAGQTITITAPGIKRVSVGNGKIADVKVLSDTQEVLVIAKEAGVTDLRVWFRSGSSDRYLLQVDGISAGPTYEEVNRLLGSIDGITVDKIRNTYLIDGQARSISDKKRVEAIAEQYPNLVSLVRGPTVERAQTVFLKARLLEVRKSALKKIGIDWGDVLDGPIFSVLADYNTNDIFRSTIAPGTGLAPLGSDVGTNYFFGMSSGLSSVINILMNDGDARMLAEPTLSCISGGQANFLAGGEVPIPLVDSDGQMSVEFKQFGILLNISPVADGEGFIQTSVEVEVSAIDPSIQVLGIPGFSTRRALTQMNVQAGETMAIAGLVSHEDAKNVDKLPGLGQIPIVGELFKSREFISKETELVVLVTPQLIASGDQLLQQQINRYDEMNNAAKNNLKFDILD